MIICYTGGNKLPSTNASIKAEEAVKRLVVTGPLLQMLYNSQRPRSAASSSGVDKTKKGPLSSKLHISIKDWTGSGMSKPMRQPTTSVPKLQTETDGMVENIKLECASEDEPAKLATTDFADTLTVNSADTFCPKITNIVSLEEMQ